MTLRREPPGGGKGKALQGIGCLEVDVGGVGGI